MNFEEFSKKLKSAQTEEDVKACYASYFKISYNTKDRHDLYTPHVLFEFKLDKNLQNLKALATVLAQTLYYIRRLKYTEVGKIIPFSICLADKNEAVITKTSKWSNYYSSDTYDWERAPSKPDQKLIDHLVKEPMLSEIHVYKITQKGEFSAYESALKKIFTPQLSLFGDKKIINEENFEAVFDHWKSIIGKYIVNGYKNSYYFLTNLQEDKIIIDKQKNQVVFKFGERDAQTQNIVMKDYYYFWSIYDYVNNAETIQGINTKLDRLTDESQRRFEGEFYTPLRFAQKAINYLEDVLGKKWYKTGKYRIWDMAAGTGNLEYNLPAESYKYMYLSTLHAGEADHLKKVFPEATCFQYNYLKDDIDYLFNKGMLPFEPNWKLPKKLRNELNDKSLTWIVYINPPFATAQVAGAKGESKKEVSKTRVEDYMNREKIGHAKRELFAQFMYRIVKEMPDKTYLGMFSTLKYLNAPDTISFRSKYFDYKYEKGFLFHSKNFHGVTGDFPIGFLLWNLAKKGDKKTINIDIADNDSYTIGIKHLRLIEKEEVLNIWFKRPENSNDYIMPPLSNGITVKRDNKDSRHRSRPDFLASICSKGNDFQNANYVVILSSPNASAGAFTVNKDNFEKALTLHAVRKIPKPTWLNDRNQFLIPHTEPSQEFMNDCVIWSLFSDSNQTTALKDVEYDGKMYQIKNNFFPFSIEELKNWEIDDTDFKLQLTRDSNRFVADWISANQLSDEAKDVLRKGKAIYKLYFSKLSEMFLLDFKVQTWDAGWFQIRRILKENNQVEEELLSLKEANQILAGKIFPQIEEYGFLDKDEVFE